MYNNPYSDETVSSKVNDPYAIEDLQPRPPLVQPAHTPAVDPAFIAAEHEAEVAEIHHNKAETLRFIIGKINDYILWFLMVLEVMLLLRFLLKLIGADPYNLFAEFLYSLTDILLFPFAGIVRSPSIHTNQAFEFSTLIAALIYYLIFYALRRFFQLMITNPSEDEAE
jgi:uncharacterized protein YggT (Ycf19 family)